MFVMVFGFHNHVVFLVFWWFSQLKFMGTNLYKLYFVYGTNFCRKVCEHASADPTSALGSWILSRFTCLKSQMFVP